jgi:ankyrin repeat protein
VIKVLLGHGANPNCVTKPSVETGSFMHDCRTKAETPLHRAAAFGTEDTIQVLLDAGAAIDAKDMNEDSPLTWASWYGRPDAILTRLCYGQFHIRPNRRSMAANLLGEPHV